MDRNALRRFSAYLPPQSQATRPIPQNMTHPGDELDENGEPIGSGEAYYRQMHNAARAGNLPDVRTVDNPFLPDVRTVDNPFLPDVRRTQNPFYRGR